MVELALVAPLLVFVILGIAEIGHGLNSYLTVVNAGRDAARLGAAGESDDSSLRELIRVETARLGNELPLPCSPGEAGICITRSNSPAPSSVRVQLCYDHRLIVGLPVIASDSLRLCSATTMRTPEEASP